MDYLKKKTPHIRITSHPYAMPLFSSSLSDHALTYTSISRKNKRCINSSCFATHFRNKGLVLKHTTRFKACIAKSDSLTGLSSPSRSRCVRTVTFSDDHHCLLTTAFLISASFPPRTRASIDQIVESFQDRSTAVHDYQQLRPRTNIPLTHFNRQNGCPTTNQG